MRVLIVEDTEVVAGAVRSLLEREDFEVDVAATAREALSILDVWQPDLVILDLLLPDLNGHAVLNHLREQASPPRVLVLSGTVDNNAKVRAFELGADQFLPKPFYAPELLARVNCLLRRRNATTQVRFGSIEVDFKARSVRNCGSPVYLRPKEFELLEKLVQHQGEVMTRQQILREVWGHLGAVHTRTVDEHVKELRKRIEPDPQNPIYIVTVRKVGYRFDPLESSAASACKRPGPPSAASQPRGAAHKTG